jgi:hypothetical protein
MEHRPYISGFDGHGPQIDSQAFVELRDKAARYRQSA